MAAQRRERVPARSGDTSVAFRLGDGTTISVPVKAPQEPTSEICCFCGEAVEHASSEHIRLEAVWSEDDGERRQSLAAHRRCLAERMHERVRGSGLIFGGPD
jgi:hypothetical protein